MRRSAAGPLIAFGIALVLVTSSAQANQPLTGAIFTTDVDCNGVDLNIYADKDDVYLDGGPRKNGPAGLPDGSYYVRVTDPSGALVLGTSVGAPDETPLVIVNGDGNCLQLSAALIRPALGQPDDGQPGYRDTPNPGGEYKAWASRVADFTPNQSKTDNFKVKSSTPEEPNTATLRVRKFYDANANGINDDDQLITGWRVRIQDGIDWIRYTPADLVLEAPDTYTVTESTPLEPNWIHTTPTIVSVPLAPGDDTTVEFGNVCLGGGGGRTIGFWGNKNGADALTLSYFTGGSSYALNQQPFFTNSWFKASPMGFGSSLSAATSNLRNYLRNATAVDMRYMLSAQASAMMLNVNAGFVSGSAIVFAPGVPSANTLGFTSVAALLADAQAALTGVNRVTQEIVKTAIDNANNNLTFAQATPCPFSFLED